MDNPGVSGMYRTIAIVTSAVKKFCGFDGFFEIKLYILPFIWFLQRFVRHYDTLESSMLNDNDQ